MSDGNSSMQQAVTRSIKAPLKTVNTQKQNEKEIKKIDNKNNKLGRAPQRVEGEKFGLNSGMAFLVGEF